MLQIVPGGIHASSQQILIAADAKPLPVQLVEIRQAQPCGRRHLSHGGVFPGIGLQVGPQHVHLRDVSTMRRRLAAGASIGQLDQQQLQQQIDTCVLLFGG